MPPPHAAKRGRSSGPGDRRPSSGGRGGSSSRSPFPARGRGGSGGESRGRGGRGGEGRGGRGGRGSGGDRDRRPFSHSARGGASPSSSNPRKSGALQFKKEKTKFHQDKFREQRDRMQQQPGRGGAGFHAGGGRGRGGARAPSSHRTADVDIHLAAKVAADLRESVTLFKTRRANQEAFGKELNERFFKFVPPMLIQQHMPDSVAAFRTYLSKFEKGAPTMVSAFASWYEWASFEANKGKTFAKHEGSFGKSEAGKTAEDEEEQPAESKESNDKDADEETKGEGGKKKMSQTRQVMSQTLREREHMRALLHMCLRHNAEKRKQGQHAFLNHLIAKLSEDDVDVRTLDRLRGTVHHSVLYALSRLLLGMVTDDFAMLCLHCHTLYLVLAQTSIPAGVLLELMDEEFALSARMKAVKLRLEARTRRDTRNNNNNDPTAPPGDDDDDDDNGIDPDEINDPTKGERNQRLMATVFALGAVVAANKPLKPAEAAQLTMCLSFTYVEQKMTRVLSANVLFEVLASNGGLYQQDEPVQWMTFAFFHYPKVEYFRPEAIQLLLRIMEASPAPAAGSLPPTVEHYRTLDPLNPATMEQLSNALFRKEQVTAYHPMVHPVWEDIFNLVVRRCAMGESMKEHLSTILHNMIVPYRRGSADIPRRALFQNLVSKLGQIAVQSDDAAQRMEVLELASRHVGYGKRTAAKPTTMQELKTMPISGIQHKVEDLLQQYDMIRDRDPAAVTNRTWVLRELRNCLYLPVREGVEHAYVDTAVTKLLQFGFFPAHSSRDTLSQNRCIFLFADVFSFTFEASLARPKSTVAATSIISAYIKAEEASKTRYSTAVQHSAFRKARNRIVEAIETAATQRSVLFYERGDMEIFLTLLFLVVSVDDPTNSDAAIMAKSVVPDIAHFYTAGTVETLDLFLDALMAIIMRVSAPLHVMPLMSCIRRIATGFVLKFAKFIRTRSSLDILLAPLREAYHTDSREQARQRKAKQAAADAEDGNSSDDDADDAADNSDLDDEDAARQDNDDDDNSSVGKAEDSGSDSSSDAATETDSDSDSDDGNGEASGAAAAAAVEGDAATDEDGEEEEEGEDSDASEKDEEDFEEEEAPTQQYIDALKGMVGNIDLEHMYPTDTANQEKADVVRAIRVVTRVGLALRSPIVVHIYQVLLAVARENVKAADDVVFVSATSAMEMLLMTKNRYFGSFVQAADLFQLLGDLQSYLRKLSRVLVDKDSTMAKAAAAARKRLSTVKALALRTLHFVAMLAYKNHAGEDVRITLSEYYKSVFCDRGWDTKKVLPGLKKDLYHYRQGFAWVLLPAAFEKCEEVLPLAGPARVRVFMACCTLVESMLSRLSGLPQELKRSASAAIRNFLQSFTVSQVFEMKHTLPYNYLHAIKMVLQYNSRVQLDTAWVATVVVTPAVDDDNILLSAASIRLLQTMERMLSLTPRARETKAPSPVKVLYQQFAKQGAKEKSDFYRRAKKVRGRILKALLAHRNDDPTDEERAVKRRRKEELKIEDRLQRQVLRSARTKALTKEEREEKRKHIMMAKQERIAKNRDRKRRLHEARLRSFEKWREAKLVAASQLDDDDDE